MRKESPVDLFRDVYDAMNKRQRQEISWLAIEGEGEDARVLGEGSWNQMIAISAAAIDEAAKCKSDTYEDYREEVIAILKGLGEGMLDGGMDYYMKRLNH